MKRRDMSRGFTLAETIMAMLIMAILGLIVTGAISTALNTYQKIVEKSNAELLLSTTISELRSELDRAEQMTLKTGNVLDKYRSSTSAWRTLSANRTNRKGIQVTEFKGYDPTGPKAGTASYDPQQLVSEAAATSKLYATFDSITYDTGKGVFTITGLKVYRKGDNKVMAEVASEGNQNYYIRSLEKPRVYSS